MINNAMHQLKGHGLQSLCEKWVERTTRLSRSATRRTEWEETHQSILAVKCRFRAPSRFVRRVAGRHRPVACATHCRAFHTGSSARFNDERLVATLLCDATIGQTLKRRERRAPLEIVNI